MPEDTTRGGPHCDTQYGDPVHIGWFPAGECIDIFCQVKVRTMNSIGPFH
jgi:hypothetical protein